MKYDDENIRRDLEDYYGTAAFGGSGPAAFADLMNVKNMSSEQLSREAQKNGFDMTKYSSEQKNFKG